MFPQFSYKKDAFCLYPERERKTLGTPFKSEIDLFSMINKQEYKNLRKHELSMICNVTKWQHIDYGHRMMSVGQKRL